jgi:hypothetical protein
MQLYLKPVIKAMKKQQNKQLYVNHIFYKDNNGFEIMHDWFKDAFLQKVGIVKAYWEDKTDVTTEKYYGLNDDELA